MKHALNQIVDMPAVAVWWDAFILMPPKNRPSGCNPRSAEDGGGDQTVGLANPCTGLQQPPTTAISGYATPLSLLLVVFKW